MSEKTEILTGAIESMTQALESMQQTNEVLLRRYSEAVEALELVDAWGNGLRHPTAHEGKMVKAARAVISKARGDK